MKIGINATIVDPSSSGLGVYAINVIRELALLHPPILVYTSAPELVKNNGVDVHEVSDAVRASRGFRGHVARVLWAHLSFPKRLREAQVSVLLSPTPLEAVLNSPVPQVLVVHDILPLRFPDSYPRQKYYYRTVVPRLLNRSARIVAVSNTTKEEVVTAYGIAPERVEVVYNGCDHNRFNQIEAGKSSLPDEVREPYLLYVGNLFPHKNLHRLLEAFALVAGELAHQLVIVGYRDPRFYPSLHAAACSLGIKTRVIFLDYVPSEMLPPLYRRADWLILPSLFEGFGMPPIEAMACGTPVLVSRTAALEETVGEAGIFFDPLNARDMGDKIFEACSDSGKRQQFRELGVKKGAVFTWKKTANELLQLLKEAENNS